MKALILNSGLGSRMGTITSDKHKSMLEISEDLPLVIYQIEAITSAGITDFVITTGYMQDELKYLIYERFGDKYRFKFIHNPKYAVTNYIYSIYLALNELNDDLILLHGDLYFAGDILSQMLFKSESVVIVDSTLPLPKKDFKARICDNKVRQIATYIDGNDCMACQPLYKLNRNDWLVWAEAIRKFCEEGRVNVYAEEALNAVLGKISLHAFDLKGNLCMEIDTPEDLTLLRSLKGDGEFYE